MGMEPTSTCAVVGDKYSSGLRIYRPARAQRTQTQKKDQSKIVLSVSVGVNVNHTSRRKVHRPPTSGDLGPAENIIIIHLCPLQTIPPEQTVQRPWICARLQPDQDICT